MLRALRHLFEDLGATYMKFGQLLGSAPGVFGEELSAEFRSCLDAGPPIPASEVVRVVENAFGAPLDDVYAEFEAEPIAAASIAVVHRARLRDGTPVAVKVLRPEIEATVTADLDIMEPVVRFLANRVGLDIAGPFLDALQILREQVAEELDLRNEARTLGHFAELLDQIDIPHLRVPRPFPDLSSRTVLTMEFLDGVPIDDLAEIEARGLDPRPMVQAVLRAWFMTSLRDGIFHGDVHAGNLLLLTDGGVGIVDWGIVGRLDPGTLTFFRDLIRASLGDEAVWDSVASHLVATFGTGLQTALGLGDDEVKRMVRNQIEPLLTKPFGEVSLSALLVGPAEAASGPETGDRGSSARATLARWKQNRRLRGITPEMSDLRGEAATFDRGVFLLAKQLLYFERYGRMYLSDVSLLEDEGFFRAILDGVEGDLPLAAARRESSGGPVGAAGPDDGADGRLEDLGRPFD